MIDWEKMYHTASGPVLHPGTQVTPASPTSPPPPRPGGAGTPTPSPQASPPRPGGTVTPTPLPPRPAGTVTPPQPQPAPPPSSPVVTPTVPVAGLYSTGFDAKGLPLSDGAGDPHWSIIATPAGPGAIPAYATIGRWPVGNPWMANTNTSRWISPRASYVAATVFAPVEGLARPPVGDAPGSYTYRTTFDLTGFDPTSVGLTVRVAVDDELANVILNGQNLGLTASGSSAFTALPINSGFVPGVNTLDFVVNNLGNTPNPSGLRVEISTTASSVVVDEMKQCPRCGQTIAQGYVVKPMGPGFMLYSPACGFLKYRLAP